MPTTYILNRLTKDGRVLYPQSTFEVADIAHERHEFSLDCHPVRDGHGKILNRYRLHTREPYRFFDTMEFDIRCPRCGDVLRLCGNPYDLYDHGLYKCRKCDDEGGR